jgi:hypothetical protein
MYENPIKEWTKPKKQIYELRICCVVDDISHTDQRIHEIRTYTNGIGAIFMSREYNSSKFSDDRNMIERLPAFHAYINKCYVETFYMDMNPREKIDKYIQECIAKEEQKKRAWNIIGWLKTSLRKSSLIRN